MPHRNQRITLVARQGTKPDVDWNYRRAPLESVAFLDSIETLRFALGAAFTEVALDVERVIIDRAGSAEEFLTMLSSLPAEFAGDMLFIRDDRSGFLSASGRGGDRVLYALSGFDVRFYLETNDLVTGRTALELAA